MFLLTAAALVLASISSASPPFQTAASDTTGLMAYWKFDDDLRDSLGRLGADARPAAAFSDGVIGKAATFSNGRYAVVQDASVLDLEMTTVAFFFRVDDLSNIDYNPCLVAKRTSSPETRFSIHVMKDSGALALWNGRGLVAVDAPAGPVKPGEWHHFAMASCKVKSSFYIDGTLCATIGHIPNLEKTNLPFVIAASSPSGEERFTGAIDELMVVNRPLSEEEVAALVDAAGWQERRSQVAAAARARIEERQRKIDERRAQDAVKVHERLSDPKLTARGETRVYEGEHLTGISFPVGGIGTGIVQFNGSAEPYAWQIFNNFKMVRVPESYFAVRAQVKGEDPVVRALQTASIGGFPAMEKLQFRGEYPFGWYDFIDSALPVNVKMELFNPLVPLNARDSAIPCAIMNMTVTNPGEKAVDVDLLAAQQNAAGYLGDQDIDVRKHKGWGKNVNKIHKQRGAAVLHLYSEQPADAPGYGDLALAVVGGKPSASADWPQPDQAYAAFLNKGRISGPSEAGPTPDGETNAGAVATSMRLKPGEARTVTFILGWHFPNVTHGAPKEKWDPSGNMYSNWYANAAEVVNDVRTRLAELTNKTRLYHDTMYQSNLPHYALDRLTSQVAVLRSPTCFWAKDGYFGGWEGCNPDAGCCHGNCGHVWHYAQAHARLFPEIARRMREQALAAQEPDGGLPFRQPSFMKAVDAQCGEILAVLREHMMSTDPDWLKAQWPRTKKAMEYMIATWDEDENGVLSGVQHNTLDINVSGSTSWLGTMYIAALRAAAVMAMLQEDKEAMQKYAYIAGRASMHQNDTLYNGEYFIQIPDEAPQHDYHTGCSIDQLLGQWWANQLNLGYLYPEDRERSAMLALIKYNFHDNFHGITQVPREFVHDDDAGLQMIQWPRENERPTPFTLYADEVWTGTEYSAAATMVDLGLVNEGLMILKAAYDRYDGRLRQGLSPGGFTSWGYSGSPFVDEECGKFYARAMSVWSVLLAAQGFNYDGTQGRIGFAPRWQPDNHQSFFAAANGFGLFSQTRTDDTQTCDITVRDGNLEVSQLVFAAPQGKKVKGIEVSVKHGEKSETVDSLLVRSHGPEEVRIQIRQPQTIQAGSSIQTRIMYQD